MKAIHYETNYSTEADRTFIIKCTENQLHELMSEEVVGFYAGEPNDQDTEHFIGSLIATYEATKYNYKKASEIFERFYDLCCDPWTMGDDEKQTERRCFMRALTRKDEELIKTYTDYADDTKHYVCDPHPSDKSKVWDFEQMREYDELINDIVNFEN